jgi:predicted DCC family thiol-disulfide oxidoreductase YuxK
MMIYDWLHADETATDDVGWAANLAIFRIAYLSAATLPFAFVILRWTRVTMPTLPVEAWQPISFYQWIPGELLRSAVLAHELALADLCLIILALLGFYTRATLAFATILSTYLFGLPQNFGKVDHNHHDIWLMVLLAAGPSGEMLSVDAMLGAIRRADRGSVDLEVSDHSALTTLRYLWLLIGVLYLGSGLSKLVAAFSSHWLDLSNLQNIIRRRWIVQRLYQRRFTVGFRYDELPPALLRLGGMGTIAFETSALFLIPFRNIRWLVIVCGLAFHMANRMILGITFTSLMIAYVCMIDWAWLGRVAMNRAGRTPVTILYDGNCDFCRRVIAILKTLDICSWVTPIAGLSSDSVRAAYPQITEEMLTRDLYAVGDNSVAGGYDAYRAIAACVPLLWPLALVMPLAPIAAIGSRCYRRVAESRHCQVKEGAAPAPSSVHSGNPWVHLTPHVVGIIMLATEAFTVVLNSGFAFKVIAMTLGIKSSEGLSADWKKVKWRWPFDQYPTFVYSWDIGSYSTWEARLVYADGSESTIPPEIFARAFASHVSITEANAQQAINSKDPLSRRTRALSMAGMLWKNLPDSARSNVVAIRGYESAYSTNPDDIGPTSRKLLDDFPIESLRADSAIDQGSR